MALHAPTSVPRAAGAPRGTDQTRRLERELAEASVLLERLLDAEDRIGLVFGVMDDARRFLARRRAG